MGNLIGMLTRVAIWAAVGGAIGLVGTLGWEMAMTGDSLGYSSTHWIQGGEVGAVVGAVLGFFKRR